MKKDVIYLRDAVMEQLTEYSRILMIVYAIAVVAYGYMITTIVFTNHTLPNAWVYPYPSFKTLSEGRWFADIIIQLGGGSGVQFAQAAIAIAIVAVNGLMFSFFLGLKKQTDVFLVLIFISLFPANLDYYAFSIDHITFAVGDTLALAGIIVLGRIRKKSLAVPISAILFTLSIAAYQPKIALVAVLLLIWALQCFAEIGPIKVDISTFLARLASPTRTVMTAAIAFTSSIFIYLLVYELTAISPDSGARGHINDLTQALSQVALAYPETWKNFTTRVEYLPGIISYLPLIAVLSGCFIFLWKVRCALITLAAAAFLLLAFPLALQMPYIINDQTFTSQGRILSSHAFFLAFFMIQFMTTRPFRKIGFGLFGLMSYFFFIVAAQGANYAAMKHIYEIEKINRIVFRIESVTPDIYERTHSIVIVGALDARGLERLRRVKPDPYGSHISSETFAPYRQTDILNFYLGRDVLHKPTEQQIEVALSTASGRRPWPAPEAVYRTDGVIVVLLQEVSDGLPITWARNR